MADPNDIHDPEPVDAEFEPADDNTPSGREESGSGSGLGSMLVVFVLASLAGGALGFTDGECGSAAVKQVGDADLFREWADLLAESLQADPDDSDD